MKRKYRQIAMGFGQRSDFTKLPQQKYDPGYSHHVDNVISISTQVSRNRQNSRVANTFGATFDEYDKSVASHALQHWTGRGPSCNLGNDGSDLEVIKKKVQAYAQSKDDRGLLMKGSFKQQRSSRLPGPGAYSIKDPTSISESLMRSMNSRSEFKKDSNMSRASRDISFAKYASNNANIYGRGLI